MDTQTSNDIKTLQNWIESCPQGGMVFFGGAGVSTESGVPDFRSSNGVYSQQYPYPPEHIISASFFRAHPDVFYDFYFSRMVFPDAKPNKAHIALAKLEEQGKLSAVVTQNIDGLHQMARSHKVLELHGSELRNHCMRCGSSFTLEDMIRLHSESKDGIPRCTCGGIIKPDVVLYEEALDSDVLEASVRTINKARLMVVAGTSLVVHPAAGLLNYFNGDHLVIVNLSPTSADRSADLCIAAKVGDVLGAVC